MSQWTIRHSPLDADGVPVTWHEAYASYSTYTFQINPNAFTYGVGQGSTNSFSTRVGYQLSPTSFLGLSKGDKGRAITFGGLFSSQAAYDGLRALTEVGLIYLIDDLERTWFMRLMTVEPHTKAPMSLRQPWRNTYTATGLLMGEPT